MTVDAFVIVPLEAFKSQEAAKKRKTEEHSMNRKEVEEGDDPSSQVPSDDDVSSQVAAADDILPPPSPPKLSHEIKEIVKKKTLSQKHFEKLLSAIEQYDGAALNVPNKHQLIKFALGRSKRNVPNQDIFFQYLLKAGLFPLVKNPFAIKKFFPLWYKCG